MRGTDRENAGGKGKDNDRKSIHEKVGSRPMHGTSGVPSLADPINWRTRRDSNPEPSDP